MRFSNLGLTVFVVAMVIVGMAFAQSSSVVNVPSNVNTLTFSNNLTAANVTFNITNSGSGKIICSPSITVKLHLGDSIKCDNVTAVLKKLIVPTTNATQPSAVLYVYYNKVLTNVTQITPPAFQQVLSDNTHAVFIYSNTTSDGSKAVNKWAIINLQVQNFVPQIFQACNYSVTLYTLSPQYTDSVACDNFRAQLVGITQPNSEGYSAALVNVYSYGILTNVTQIPAYGSVLVTPFNSNGLSASIQAQDVFDGLYLFQKWAYIGIFPQRDAFVHVTDLNVKQISSQTGSIINSFSIPINYTGLAGSEHTYGDGLISSYVPVSGSVGSPFNLVDYTIFNHTINFLYTYPNFSYSGPVNITVYSYNVTNPNGCGTYITVYVGHNVSCSGFSVELTDLGQPNQSGISPASLNVYYNGTLTNTTQIEPGKTVEFTTNGKNLYVNVNQTFAGLYAYQKWAKMDLTVSLQSVVYGPYGIGQSTNLPNVKILNVSIVNPVVTLHGGYITNQSVTLVEAGKSYGPYSIGQSTYKKGLSVANITGTLTINYTSNGLVASISNEQVWFKESAKTYGPFSENQTVAGFPKVTVGTISEAAVVNPYTIAWNSSDLRVWLEESGLNYGPYEIGQATNIQGVSIDNINADATLDNGKVIATNQQVWLSEIG
jgi:hypothetical protein